MRTWVKKTDIGIARQAKYPLNSIKSVRPRPVANMREGEMALPRGFEPLLPA